MSSSGGAGEYIDNTAAFQDFGFDDNTNKIKNPFVTIFHIFFKISALTVYLLCGIVSDSFISSFVTTTLLLSLDFWTVKNITGRIMVGLRWWNYINDDGKSVWVFESRKPDQHHNTSTTEVRIFWAALVAAPLMWALFFLVALFKFSFSWLVLVLIGLTLSGSNLLGYLRCKMGKSDEGVGSVMSGVANQYMQKQMMSNFMGMFKRNPPTAQATNLTV
jgi:hypothetical protein